MLDMLPVAGGGTLSNRFYDADAKKSSAGWLRAKTGSLIKTNSLVGIVTDLSGRVLTFAFSSNAGNRGRTAIDALAATLHLRLWILSGPSDLAVGRAVDWKFAGAVGAQLVGRPARQ